MSGYSGMDGTGWAFEQHLDKPIYPDTLEQRIIRGFDACRKACLNLHYSPHPEIREAAASFLAEQLLDDQTDPTPVVKDIRMDGMVYLYLTTPSQRKYRFVTKFREPKIKETTEEMV